MGFKPLTGKGITFIRTVCKGSGNSLLSGKQKYALPNSGNPASTIYTANATDNNGDPITKNSQLGEALIFWFNDYAQEFNLDANIMAAQAFIESKYALWAYSNTGAQGLSQFLSGTLYDVAIGGFGDASHISIEFSDDEKDRLTVNLTNPKQQNSYVYKDSNPALAIAKANKSPFFQNIMDNPDLIIKAQCRLMAGIGIKAANNAASSLYGYNQGSKRVSSTFTKTAKLSENTRGYEEGIQYIKKIFRVLGDVNNTDDKAKGIWFGYNIDFTFDSFEADVQTSNIDIDNVQRNKKLSDDYILGDLIVTSTGILNIPTSNDIFNLEALAKDILQKITDNIVGGEKLTINSSFRNPQLNAEIGGVVTSQHQSGEAADVRISATNTKDLYEVFQEIVVSTIPYDQIIYETKGEDIESKWIHISYKKPLKDSKGKLIDKNRNQAKLATLGDAGMIYEKYP